MMIDPERVMGHSQTRNRLHRAWRLAEGFHGRIVLLVGIMGGSALLEIGPPLVFKRIIDDAIPNRDLSQVVLLGALAAAMSLAAMGLSIGAAWLSSWLGNRLVEVVRIGLFDHFMSQPLGFFVHTQTGRIQQRLMGDAQIANSLFTGTLASTLRDAFALTVTVAAMATLSPLLTIGILALSPGVVFASRWVGVRSRRYASSIYNNSALASSLIGERLTWSGAILLRMFNAAERERERLAKPLQEIRKDSVRANVLAGVLVTSLTLVGAWALVLVYLVGADLVIRGALSIGSLVALAVYVQRLYTPIVDLASTRIALVNALVAFERILEVMDLPKETSVGSATIVTLRGIVRLEDVWYRYPAPAELGLASLASTPLSTAETGWVLKGISLETQPGAITAIVGHSGAGKSTLCNLILGLERPTRGKIRIDDFDLAELGWRGLSPYVALVPQDPVLFQESIADNLRLAKPDATDAELEAVCEAARLTELIRMLPDGLGTIVGERGHRMSGGERQRLAIARALLKNAPLVVLDEATAHLDSATERDLFSAFEVLMEGRTVFVIAHRLSTVRRADRVIVLDRGELVGDGDHNDLLRSCAVYATWHSEQAAV